MVSEKRPCIGNRNFQQRNQCCCHCRSSADCLDFFHVWMAESFFLDRCSRIYLVDLSGGGYMRFHRGKKGLSAGEFEYIHSDPDEINQRSATKPSGWSEFIPASTNLGHYFGKISDRSRMVVLSFLDSFLF